MDQLTVKWLPRDTKWLPSVKNARHHVYIPLREAAPLQSCANGLLGNTYLPWSREAFTRINLVRHNGGHGKGSRHWVFYEIRHNSHLMWAVPCKFDEHDHVTPLFNLLTGRNDVLCNDEAHISSAMETAGTGSRVVSYLSAALLNMRKADLAQRDAKRNQEAKRKADLAQRDAKRNQEAKRKADHAKQQLKLRAEELTAQRKKIETQFDRDAEHHKQFYARRQQEEAAAEEATQASVGESSNGAEILNPQHDQDAALALLNELNGHELSWAADHPPPLHASEGEVAAWRNEVLELINSEWVSTDVERARELVEEKLLPQVGVQASLCACASCGIRMAERGYECWNVDELPKYFELDQKQLDDREALGTLELYDLHPVTGELRCEEAGGSGSSPQTCQVRYTCPFLAHSYCLTLCCLIESAQHIPLYEPLPSTMVP